MPEVTSERRSFVSAENKGYGQQSIEESKEDDDEEEEKDALENENEDSRPFEGKFFF